MIISFFFKSFYIRTILCNNLSNRIISLNLQFHFFILKLLNFLVTNKNSTTDTAYHYNDYRQDNQIFVFLNKCFLVNKPYNPQIRN